MKSSMRHILNSVMTIFVVALIITPICSAQQTNSAVPALVNFSGTLTDANHKPLTGTVGVTFYLYNAQQGGSPLWMETQNVQPDRYGHYTVQLGSTTGQGLPTDVFVSGEARWLGVQAQGLAEQPRVLLLSVPYALKAGDAQTIGGLPASAFLLASPSQSGSTTGGEPANAAASLAVGGSGTADFIPLWTSSQILSNSVLFQSGSGSTAQVGVNTTTPGATLDVNGGVIARGAVQLPSTGTANASQGFNSQPFSLQGSAFNSSTQKAIGPLFQWQTEPSGNNSSNPAGTLNLLYGAGSGSPTETGLNIASNGQITFAKGQSFPGSGTITGVTAGTDLLGGGNSGNVSLSVDTTKVMTGIVAGTDLTGGGNGGVQTLNLDTTKVPQLGAANTFTNNQTVNGNITASGAITGQTGSFSGNNNTDVLNVTQAGVGLAIAAAVPSNPSLFTPAILGTATGTNNLGVGVQGNSSAQYGYGVWGQTANGGWGVVGASAATSGGGVYGEATSTASGSFADGVLGISNSESGIGVDGANGSTIAGIGVRGYSGATSGIGVYGFWNTQSSSGAGSSDIGVWGDSSNGIGLYGTSDSNDAVEGFSSGNVGIVGNSNSYEGVFGGGRTGLFGVGNSIAGMYGQLLVQSNSGSGWSNVGAWGDTGVSGAVGVLGTVDDGNALFGVNNTVNHETLYAANNSGFNGGTPIAARFAGPGASTYCYIPRDSNDNGTGDLVCTGSKSAAVPVDGNRMVRLYAVEAADNWFEDAGSGQLTNGIASIPLDGTFSQTVDGDLDYHVFLTPNGDCDGLYVTNKTARGFEVHELRGGHSSVAFDYRIMARRKGFEKVRMQDVTAEFAQMKRESQDLATKMEANKAKEKVHPSMIIPSLPKKSSWRMPPLSHPPVLPQRIAQTTVERKK